MSSHVKRWTGHFFTTVVLIALIGSATYLASPEYTILRILALVVTWVGVLVFMFGGIASMVMKKSSLIVQSYLDGDHAPIWFDQFTYLSLVAILFSHEWYWTAGAWAYMGAQDLWHRYQAMKVIKLLMNHVQSTASE